MKDKTDRPFALIEALLAWWIGGGFVAAVLASIWFSWQAGMWAFSVFALWVLLAALLFAYLLRLLAKEDRERV
jgi:hypothetical protein